MGTSLVVKDDLKSRIHVKKTQIKMSEVSKGPMDSVIEKGLEITLI